MTRRRWIADTFNDSSATLLGAQAEHLTRVLRAQIGTEAEVVANGRVYLASIVGVRPQEVNFQLLKEVPYERALPVALVLAIFKFDRMEWAIEKATELGVATIAPVVARRTEKHLAQAADKRVERWRRIAQEAAQQSRRADMPAIAAPVTLPAWLQQPTSAQRIVLSEEERATALRERIGNALDTAQGDLPGFAFAIGPEGGWTREELAMFAQHHWQPATLGPRILRAETAAIATLALASALL